MAKLKIKIQPLFLIYFFVCIYFGWVNIIFYYVIAVVLHEYGHFIAIRHYGYKVDSLIFSLYGGSINTNNCYKSRDDIIISIAGPLVNLILTILSICSWWLFPSLYFYTYEFVLSNIAVMIFNLLPLFPLDGGRIVLALIKNKSIQLKSKKIMNLLSFILGIGALIVFLISMFFGINFNLLFIGLFLIMNSIVNDNSKYYSKIKIFNKNQCKPIEIKYFRINNMDKKEMINCLSPHYYTIFELKKNEKIFKITEDELINKY